MLLNHRVVLTHGTLQLVCRCLAVHIAQHYRDVLHDAETDQLGCPNDHGLSGAPASEQLRRYRDRHAASYFEGERCSLRVKVYQRRQLCENIKRFRSKLSETVLELLIIRFLARRLRRVVPNCILVALKRRRLTELLTVLLYMLVERLLVAVRCVIRTLHALLFRKSMPIGAIFVVQHG